MNQDIAQTNPAETAHWVETLRDGTQVLIRPMRKGDAAAERNFICSLSAESRRMRFLGQIGTPSDATIERLTNIDFSHEAAFIAKPVGAEDGPIVGVARYGMEPAGTRCECAVVVDDHWQHRGLGTRLMQHLVDIARLRGIGTMYSIDTAENQPMADLAKHLGFSRRGDPGDRSQVIHELAL